jgi:ribosomal protein S4
MGLGPSFVSIRQYISHGFVFVNGRELTISSSFLKPGDVISIKKPFPSHWKLLWSVLLKNKQFPKHPVQHLEINYKLCQAIVLFQPQQIYYPCQFQLQSVLRFLSR